MNGRIKREDQRMEGSTWERDGRKKRRNEMSMM
jgi:hypothetical protein